VNENDRLTDEFLRDAGFSDNGSSGPPDAMLAARLLTGGAILDVPPIPTALWGDDDEILWAAGQSVIIAGPDGVGKTTLAANLIRARLGLGTGSVLGLPVQRGERNVLVLLMDRPQQAMAVLARLFTEADRDILNARLRVWRGPPPQDLARHTGMLAHLCMLADADTCVTDSLKDAALRLSDDETGAGWNQARQIAIEAGTQLAELHHPRKGQEGNRKPSKLDDLYGSRWISAGAGSVVSLWGEAGDPVVSFTHLKPVLTTVGPWLMNIDGESGLVSRDHGAVDLVEQIRQRGRNGITVQVAARLLSGEEKPARAQVERARRKLEKKVAAGILVRLDGHKGGDHGGDPAVYHLKAITEANTEQSRAGQAITRTEVRERTRNGGDINPPFRDRWTPGPPGSWVQGIVSGGAADEHS
jgi:replicative DNA helicase